MRHRFIVAATLGTGVVVLSASCGVIESLNPLAGATSASASGSASAGDPGGDAATGGGGATSAASGSASAGGGAASGSAATSAASASATSAGATTATSSSSSSTTSSSSTGTGLPGLGAPCTYPAPCGPGLYCATSSCGPGVCDPMPDIISVPWEGDPVCGCDHQTYWNKDVAAAHGVPTLAVGACPDAMAVPCDAATPCPPGSKCNRRAGTQAQCTAAGAGVCWSMPISCPVDGPKARACSNGACATVCDLIQSQHPWWDDGTCP